MNHQSPNQNHSQKPLQKKEVRQIPEMHMGSNPSHGHTGHDHHKMMIADFKKRFFIVLVLTVPVMLLSPMIQHWLNIHWEFTGSQYLLAGLSSVVFFYV